MILKYVSEATVVCNRCVRIGAYALNSNITAKELIVEGSNGCIIGGKIEVVSKVQCPSLGSSSEQLTRIIVKGFRRDVLKQELEKNMKSIERTKQVI